MDFYERLEYFIKSKDETISGFERVINVSNGTIGKCITQKRSLGIDKVLRIFSKYPDLDANWLLKGDGAINGVNAKQSSKDAIIRLLQKQIENYNEVITLLKEE